MVISEETGTPFWRRQGDVAAITEEDVQHIVQLYQPSTARLPDALADHIPLANKPNALPATDRVLSERSSVLIKHTEVLEEDWPDGACSRGREQDRIRVPGS